MSASVAFPSTPETPVTSWTPVLTFATPGDLSVAYSTQAGSYVRIGKMVFLRWQVTTSTFTHTTASGALVINGVPFAASASLYWFGSSMLWRGITKANYTDVAPRVLNSQIDFVISGSGQTNAQVVSTDTPTGGTVNLAGCITYPVA